MKTIVTRTRAEVYDLWDAALRSKKYKQSDGTLRKSRHDGKRNRVTGFCCVGVLCDLANKDRKEKWVCGEFEYHDLSEFTGTPTADDLIEALSSESSEMPAPMREWMGLTEDEVNDLYTMNDDKGLTFVQIANHIKKVIWPRALQRPMPFVE